MTIDAAPADVWAVLCDVGRWPEWYPDVSRATGTIRVGSQVALARVFPSGRTVITRLRVVAVKPGVELRMRSAAGAESSFTLNPIDSDARTQVVNSSNIPGPLMWLAGLLAALADRNLAEYARARMDAVNEGLKYRAEQGPGTTQQAAPPPGQERSP